MKFQREVGHPLFPQIPSLGSEGNDAGSKMTSILSPLTWGSSIPPEFLEKKKSEEIQGNSRTFEEIPQE